MEKKEFIYGYLIASLFLLIFDYFSLLNEIKSPFSDLVSPLKSTVFLFKNDAVSYIRYLSSYKKTEDVWQENRKLRREKDEVLLRLHLTDEENEKLRSQLGAALPSSFQFVPAQVLSVSDTMEIAVGEKEGIKPGMTVVVGTSFLGLMKSVAHSTSVVKLPTDPSLTVAVKTERYAKGMLVGQRGGSMLLTRVLQKEPLFLGDKLYTTGEDEIAPQLFVGKVASIVNDTTNAYKQAKIDPAVDFTKETIVFVVTAL